jgi:hypothetical protein
MRHKHTVYTTLVGEDDDIQNEDGDVNDQHYYEITMDTNISESLA